MKTERISKIAIAGLGLVLAGGIAVAAQVDRYTLKIPGGGLPLSDFRGYDGWQTVAASATESSIKVIVANPVMIAAYKSGVPAGGRKFPEGSKVAKIEWTKAKNPESPYFVEVPTTLKSLAFIEKDSKRFPDTHGWAYAAWSNDPATGKLSPEAPISATGHTCGYSCHSAVANKDYIFTGYPKR